MNTLDTGKDKIQKITEILKNETLEPAKLEAQKVIEAAQSQAHDLIREGEKKAQERESESIAKMNRERELFENSLKVACKQTLEALRQEIEEKLFNGALLDWVEENTADSKVGADLVNALVEAIEKDGVSADFSAFVPKKVAADRVNAALQQKVVERLKEKGVMIGEFAAGIQVKLHDRKMTLDLSEDALKALISKYVRKKFRDVLING